MSTYTSSVLVFPFLLIALLRSHTSIISTGSLALSVRSERHHCSFSDQFSTNCPSGCTYRRPNQHRVFDL